MFNLIDCHIPEMPVLLVTALMRFVKSTIKYNLRGSFEKKSYLKSIVNVAAARFYVYASTKCTLPFDYCQCGYTQKLL